ncbi:hypothetical protein OQA88_2319 [Cercophora sp. LCS_1]
MQSIKSTGLIAMGLLAGLGSAIPAPQDPILTVGPGVPTGLPTGILTVPQPTPTTCSSVVGGITIGPKCHTHTTTELPKTCKPVTGIACPAYVIVSTVSVPCNSECCPTTRTRTVSQACPTGCVIPTITETVTTGCPKATILPIPTGILTVG